METWFRYYTRWHVADVLSLHFLDLCDCLGYKDHGVCLGLVNRAACRRVSIACCLFKGLQSELPVVLVAKSWSMSEGFRTEAAVMPCMKTPSVTCLHGQASLLAPCRDSAKHLAFLIRQFSFFFHVSPCLFVFSCFRKDLVELTWVGRTNIRRLAKLSPELGLASCGLGLGLASSRLGSSSWGRSVERR